MLHSLSLKIATVLIGLASFLIGAPTVSQPNFGSYSPTGGGTYRLQTSVGSSDSTLTLSNFKEPVSNIPYTMSYLGSDVEYITFDPQTTRAEFASFNTITQNSDGTATLGGLIRGLSRTPGTPGGTGTAIGCIGSTTLSQAHAGQSIVILSNPPCQLAEYLPLRTTATSSAIVIFSSTTPPRYDFTGVQHNGTYIATTSEFASIDYVNQVSFAGTTNGTEAVKGIWQGATAFQDASSTILGGTGAGLLMQSRYATDTPQSGCAVNFTSVKGAGCTPIASLLGVISPFYLATSTLYTYNWNASTTFSGPFSIAASSSVNNVFRLNSLPYVFPSVRGASSTVLTEDGTGNLKFLFSPDNVLDVSGSNLANLGNNSSSTVRTVVIPAGTLSTTTVLRITAYGKLTQAGSPYPAVDIQFGNGSASTTIAFAINSNTITSNPAYIDINTSLFVTGSNAQQIITDVGSSTPLSGSSSLPTGDQTGIARVSSQSLTTTSFTQTVPLYLSFRVNAGGNASSVAQLNGISVEALTH